MYNTTLLAYLETAGLTQTDKVLATLLALDTPAKPSQIQNILHDNGVRESKKWNVCQLLKATKYTVNLKHGWILTVKGKEHISKKLKLSRPEQSKVISSLHDHLTKIKSTQGREFIEEAIRCFEIKCFRAAVVLCWSGALGVLYDQVLKNYLSAFNTALAMKLPKSKQIHTFDDLALLKENDFLEVAFSASVIDKNLKTHLQNTCLKLRNSCGHPNTFKVSEHQVQAHIELLTLNVFEKFQ